LICISVFWLSDASSSLVGTVHCHRNQQDKNEGGAMQSKSKKTAVGGVGLVKLSLVILTGLALAVVLGSGGNGGGGAAALASDGITDFDLTNIELLGKYVFFDKISSPNRMACVTCHLPETGGTGGVSGVNLHQVVITGANPHTLGNLKPPTNAYASLIEKFNNLCGRGGLGPLNVCGGNFWNGRAEGRDETLGALFPAGATKHIGEEIFYTSTGDGIPISSGVMDLYRGYFGPTADQALNPMPNKVEQNIDRKAVCNHVKSAKYAPLYRKVWGVNIDCSENDVTEKAPDVSTEKAFDISFKRIMLAVCAWQDSADLNSFSSKRDKALAADTTFPLDGLTAQENLGHDLFYNTLPVPFAPVGIPVGPGVFNNLPFPGLPATNCSFCHTSGPRVGVAPERLGTDPLERYTDDAYHIIGTPRNPEIPKTFDANGNPIDPDLGIAGHAGPTYPPGFFKTPTLRNVDKRKDVDFIKAYAHNGWFKSMESIVHFYNTSFLGGPTGPGGIIPYENTTAAKFGITRCPDGIETEKDALANNCWPAPAYPGAAPILVGNLGLNADQEAAIVAYLKTLTDEHTSKAPKPYKK
jgi:cytochrome c peroxidase